ARHGPWTRTVRAARMAPEKKIEVSRVVVPLDPPSAPFERARTLMPDERRPDDRAPEPARFRTQAEIRFLVDNEEALVEQADRAEHGGRNHHAAAVHDVDRHQQRLFGINRYQQPGEKF